MSAWDSYLNANIATGTVIDKAIIVDQTGQAVWGKSSSIQLSADQMKKIALVFSDPSDAQGNGLHFESKRYVFNKIEDIENIPVMHSKSGKEGIVAAKCKASILISHYPENSSAGEAVNFIHGQAKYLIQNNL
ncbi:hypothetical protein UA08_02187 [Talaromyces atroroseus]|uniref:Profilin n=1 Tax=Talaromyces atroroseus TaxID=1441469 RepID=A0A225AKN6_TALAT|nr:hypothetical protein UA08_02187 [Talaromyces atroroseus]OKL62121.1 hypothetical protein UA08_02187 [Talaromyces atroroseus]